MQPIVKAVLRSVLCRQAIVAVLSVGALTAVAANPKASQLYEDALVRFENKDYKGAVVQLKNVLRADNKNLSAQVLLGKALLEDNAFGGSSPTAGVDSMKVLGVSTGIAVPEPGSLALVGLALLGVFAARRKAA